MYSLKISNYIIRSSFVLWNIVLCFFIGFDSLYIGLIFFLFILPWEVRVPFEKDLSLQILMYTIILLTIFNLVNVPNLLSNNFLFNPNAVENIVQNANDNVGKGRSFGELLTSFFIIVPFILIDNLKKFKGALKVFVLINCAIFLTAIIGISRGMFSLVVLSISLPFIKNLKYFIIILVVFFYLYVQLSILRDGVVDNVYTPVLESFSMPGYLGGQLFQAQLEMNSLDYIKQIFLKIFPSFIFEKNIFSFNIEMTKTIYPHMGEEVSAISVFTYVSELLIYKPIILTILFSILVLRILLSRILFIIQSYKLHSTILFISFYFLIVLRSRIPDLISVLLMNLIFLEIFHFLNRIILASRK